MSPASASPVESSSAVPGASTMYGPSRSARRFCQNGERLKPSKPTEPSMTAMNASMPGVASRPARPENGTRTTSRPSRSPNGAIRASRPK